MIHMTFILSKQFSPLHYSACHQTVFQLSPRSTTPESFVKIKRVVSAYVSCRQTDKHWRLRVETSVCRISRFLGGTWISVCTSTCQSSLSFPFFMLCGWLSNCLKNMKHAISPMTAKTIISSTFCPSGCMSLHLIRFFWQIDTCDYLSWQLYRCKQKSCHRGIDSDPVAVVVRQRLLPAAILLILFLQCPSLY